MKRLLLGWNRTALAIVAIAAISEPATSRAQDYSVPIRWCAVEGTSVVDNPGCVGADSTDHALWKRHERASEKIFIPQTGVTFRSALWNIVEDPTLNFPVIPDPYPPHPSGPCGNRNPGFCDNADSVACNDNDDCPDDVLGDIQQGDEAFDALNACHNEWKIEHGTDNIGITALVARKFLTSNGDTVFAYAYAGLGAVFLTDNPQLVCGSCNTCGEGCCDPSDAILGHELAHAMPTQAVMPSITQRSGLGHTCGNTNNIMRPSPGMRTDLSTSIQHIITSSDGVDCNGNDTFEWIDQIAAIRAAAQEFPGCKLDGTNTNCSARSDVRIDALEDVSEDFIDIVRARITDRESSDSTEFVHELLGRFTAETFTEFSTLEYFFVLNLDDDPSTGGDPSELGLPSDCGGAELITRVEVRCSFGTPGDLCADPTYPDQEPLVSLTPTVWEFNGISFVEVGNPGIEARLVKVFRTAGDLRGPDLVLIEVPNDVRGPISDPFFVQAVSRGITVSGLSGPMDVLQAGPCLEFRHRFPTFPTCSVTPDPVPAGSTVTVDASGLLPDSAVHVVVGAEDVANGVTDASGDASIEFQIPGDVEPGKHLVTVGVDGTGLTADCVVETTLGPIEPPIPTVSEWSLIVLTLLGFTAGTLLFTLRRRPAVA